MNYTPDLRAPIVQMFSPWPYHPTDNPRSFTTEWANEETADAYLTTVLDRFAQTDRGIMMMPMGKQPGLFPSSQWHTGEQWRQELLIRKCNDWMREDRLRTLSIFVGTRPAKSQHHLSMAGNVAPNPYDTEALGRFVGNTLPWVTNFKIHRLWLDHSSHASNYEHVRSMANWTQLMWGLQIGIEAFRTTHVGPGTWDLHEQALLDHPGSALSKFVQVRDAEQEWICPSGAEAIVILRTNDNPTQEWVDSLRQRGFTVGSVSPDTDQLVI